MLQCTDPNAPSYDPAMCNDATTKKLVWLCERAWERMTAWERKFCQEVYGKSPMTRRQHIQVWKIHRKHAEQK